MRSRALTGWPPVVLAIACLLWLSIYISRESFFLAQSIKTNSMHGVWMTLASKAPFTWWQPTWWPFWYAGMPLEFTYAPLIPNLLAAMSAISGWPVERCFQALGGAVYCAGPVAFFVLARVLSGSLVYSFAAAIAYALTTFSGLFFADQGWKPGEGLRMHLIWVWDDLPHLTAIAFVCLAVAAMHWSFGAKSRARYVLAGLLCVLSVLANAFGATDLVIALGCWIAAFDQPLRRLRHIALIGIPAYAVASPWFPPSLILAIRTNAPASPESAWGFWSPIAVAGVIATCVLIRLATRRLDDPALRFALALAFVMVAIPWLYIRWGVVTVPQPARYRLELDLALTLAIAFLLRAALMSLPRAVPMLAAAALIWPGAQQVIRHRRDAKTMFRDTRTVESTIEYRVARWIDAHPEGGRIFGAGSIGQWLNLFTERHQYTGGSYPTANNPVQQIGMHAIYTGKDDDRGRERIGWAKAYGVRYLAVSGRNSPEFWRPFQRQHDFEQLKVLWREEDTTIFEVPLRSSSLAHALPREAIVPNPVSSNEDGQRYVDALDAEPLPAPEAHWRGNNEIVVRGTFAPGRVLSLQVNHHRGWKATSRGALVPMWRDGLGLIAADPQCGSPCEVLFRYDGGVEAKATRAVSLLVALGAIILLVVIR